MSRSGGSQRQIFILGGEGEREEWGERNKRRRKTQFKSISLALQYSTKRKLVLRWFRGAKDTLVKFDTWVQPSLSLVYCISLYYITSSVYHHTIYTLGFPKELACWHKDIYIILLATMCRYVFIYFLILLKSLSFSWKAQELLFDWGRQFHTA